MKLIGSSVNMINESQNKYFGKFCDLWLRYRDKECYRELCKYYPSSFYNISKDIQVLFSGLNPSFDEKKIKNKEDFIFSNGKPEKCIEFDTNSLEEYDYFENIRKCCKNPDIEWGFADIFHNRMSSQNEFMQYVNNKVFAEFFIQQLVLYLDLIRYISKLLTKNKILIVFTNKQAFNIFMTVTGNQKNFPKKKDYKDCLHLCLGDKNKMNLEKNFQINIKSASSGKEINEYLYKVNIEDKEINFVCFYGLVKRRVEKDLKKLAVVKVKELIKEKINV